MGRAGLRLSVLDDGGLDVVDPGFDTLDLLREIDPNFAVAAAPLRGFTRPRALDLDLAGRAALARHALGACDLCARGCRVNRLAGERGTCGLGVDGVVAEHFVHIGEEAPINPSLVISLAGCGMRCRYCQQGRLLDPRSLPGRPLDASLWADLDFEGARSLSFVGGNPDESLPAILGFLAAMPGDFALPLVWNSHAYATESALALLDGVVDAFVPDLKYDDERCARRLSGVRGYPERARRTIRWMLAQGVPVIVRVLVLPGHAGCCHLPALEWLANLDADALLVSVRGQYSPDWRITGRDGAMNRRATGVEVARVRGRARELFGEGAL